jgi:chemotaxis protein methyltransferase WspC
MDTTAIRALLVDRLGLDPDSLGPSFFEWVTRRGLRESGCRDLNAFVDAAEAGGSAWETLVDHAVVAETWFFRDETPFDHVVGAVRQKALGSAAQVRILSCPCSTGEEPYSVAIALTEAGLPPSAFWIDAADVSLSALAAAQSAMYRPRAIRGPRPDRHRCFDHDAASRDWRLKAGYRAMVHFRRANLVSLQGFDGLPPYDVILCRNLLIYLHAQARAAVMAAVRGMLTEDGVLIVGHAEPAIAREHGFVGDGPPGAFAFVQASAAAVSTPARNRRRSSHRHSASTERAIHAGPGRTSGGRLSDRVEPSRPTLDGIRRVADRGDVAQAIAACLEFVRSSPDSAEGHYLLGVLHGAAGREQAAEAALRRAVYLQPDHAEALLHLALAREARGDMDGAARLRTRAAASAQVAERRHD